MNREKTTKMILTGLMMAMIVVATSFITIPTPGGGYIHFGDTMIFLSVLILGWRYGAVAAGFGSALADLIAGYPVWMLWTLVIKGLMAVTMGLFIQKAAKKPGVMILGVPAYHLVGMILAGLEMAAGYCIAGGIIYGNFITSILGIPLNILQFGVGAVLATMLAAALYKTPARKFFTYQPTLPTNRSAVEMN
jgi:uncharacterized membrane protein